MHLSDHDLRQLDDAALAKLTPEQAHALLGKALADLKAAREKLAQNPSNNSQPPSTRAPWEQDETKRAGEPGAEYEEKQSRRTPTNKGPEQAVARPGRRKGGARRTTVAPENFGSMPRRCRKRCARCRRTARSASTGMVYEVDAALVGETVTLRFDPSAPRERPVQVCFQGQPLAMARPVDTYANCFIKRDRPSRNLAIDVHAPEGR